VTKITNAKFKASRRLGVSIWGDDKDPIHKRNYRPGQHGVSGQHKTSDFGAHLKEKQKLKLHYGTITEKQFRNTFKKASKKKGNTAEIFVAMLESRLDAVIYRLNLAPTIFAARQIVSHRHVKVNGRTANIPSMQLKPGDEVELKDKSKQIPVVVDAVENVKRPVPDYLELEAESRKGKFVREPYISDVPYPFEPQVNMVVEYYSH
jgi:small subunit ribosomal protein S4